MRATIAWLLAAFMTAGCGSAAPSSRASEPQPIAQAARPAGGNAMQTRLSTANNQFGFDLFNQLQRQEPDKNLFISPLSIATALAMTYNGAAGATEQAMTQTLKLDGLSLAQVNQASAALLQSLKSADPKIELAIANSLWARQGVKFKEDFLARNRQFFGAEIATLNFGSPQAAATINRWVNASTKGKIPQIIDQIDAQTVMFLINAVYFKGLWQTQFNKALTKNETFHLLAGREKQMPMMSQSGDYQYLRGANFQAVSLPYGNGGVSLYLFLPAANSSLRDFLQGLSYQKWEQWMKQFRQTPGEVKLPRFKLDYERNLNDPLKALGMAAAFSANEANFTRMRTERDLFIQQVKHKAVVEVNEEGTEAAAATAVGIAITSAVRPQQPFSFIADRPFFMAIRDRQSGSILFMGAVIEPK